MLDILFVCTGNICRTPMAEYLLKDMINRENLQNLMQVGSAGTGALEGYPAAELTTAVGKAHGIDTTPHRARSVSPQLLKEADIVLCMERHHLVDLYQIFPHFREKIFLLKKFAMGNSEAEGSIKDPYGGPKSHYEETFLEIKEEVERIWPELKRLANAKK